MDWADVLLGLVAVLGLIAINAFFVTAEFAMVWVRRSRINQLVEEGNLQAKRVQSLQRNIDRLLSATQLGITLSSLALGWIGEKTMAALVATAFTQLPLPKDISGVMVHSLAIPVAFLGVAYLQIVLGELCPKSVALLYPEQLALALGPPSLTIARFFNPFIWILNQSTQMLLRLAGIRYAGQGWYNRITPEELRTIVATERESIGLEAEERQLLTNVFEFGEVTAGEVMIPRTSIRAISSEATISDLIAEVATHGHSRYPVMGESLDDIRGIIDFKELANIIAQAMSRGQSTGTIDSDSSPASSTNINIEAASSPNTSITPWMRPARFVPEYMLLSELLPLMQRSRRPMVMVVDEFGGTAGLVTINDLIAQIIGDTHEPENSVTPQVVPIDDFTFLVQAQIDLEELNEFLNLELPLIDEYQTLGGFILYHFQKIPTIGETLYHDNLEFTVVSADGPRLDQIRLHLGKGAFGRGDQTGAAPSWGPMEREEEETSADSMETNLDTLPPRGSADLPLEPLAETPLTESDLGLNEEGYP
ncbi:MAG: hemolysin family protein [Oscillatoriaceae cyanobacterium]